MKKYILIIDDDSRNIFALTAVLKSKGFYCLSAPGMAEAFVVLKNNHEKIDIILLDMMMPEMDGYEAIPNIKAVNEYQHIPIVAVTAQAMAGDREKCLAAGADDYISKPVNIDLLLDIIKNNMR